MYKSCGDVCIIFLGYIPRMKIVALSRNSVFNRMRNCQAVFQNSSTICVSISLYEGSNFFTNGWYCLSFIIATLVDVKGISHCVCHLKIILLYVAGFSMPTSVWGFICLCSKSIRLVFLWYLCVVGILVVG